MELVTYLFLLNPTECRNITILIGKDKLTPLFPDRERTIFFEAIPQFHKVHRINCLESACRAALQWITSWRREETCIWTFFQHPLAIWHSHIRASKIPFYCKPRNGCSWNHFFLVEILLADLWRWPAKQNHIIRRIGGNTRLYAVYVSTWPLDLKRFIYHSRLGPKRVSDVARNRASHVIVLNWLTKGSMPILSNGAWHLNVHLKQILRGLNFWIFRVVFLSEAMIAFWWASTLQSTYGLESKSHKSFQKKMPFLLSMRAWYRAFPTIHWTGSF